MSTDIKLLPPPKWLLEGFTDPTIERLCDYTRANVEHYTAAKDAEIEALRAELDRLRGEHVRVRRDRNAAEARAERLAEALRPLANLDLRPDGFDKRPDDQTIYARDRTAITVGDVRCARAALRDHDQEREDG